jgi:hypothetical protein
MTRSELLEKAIKLAKNGVEYEPQHASTRELNAFALELFLAEQKRSEGCAYCNGNMLDGYALENMYGESQRIINLAMKNHRSGDQLPISFCPNCGRSLTDGESE